MILSLRAAADQFKPLLFYIAKTDRIASVVLKGSKDSPCYGNRAFTGCLYAVPASILTYVALLDFLLISFLFFKGQITFLSCSHG